MKRFISILSGFLLIFLAVAGFAQEAQLAKKAAENVSLPNGFKW